MNDNLPASEAGERLGKGAPCPKASPGERFIQIGVTALRDPKTGEYLPAVPMYIKADAESKAAEDALMRDIGRLFADRMRRYQTECKALAKARFGAGRSLPQPFPKDEYALEDSKA